MDIEKRSLTTGGFSLTELMTVLAIVSVLIAVGAASYSRFITKAKSVEAEIALSEIHRLEQIHYASTGTYTANVDELGFRPFQPLKYHSLFVQVAGESGNGAFRALAVPLSGSGGQTFSVVQYAASKPSSSGGAGLSGQGSGPELAFGGEGWSDEGIIRLETGGAQKGGIEKTVSNPKPSSAPKPASK
ncbi:MAG: prepilin-type N-terminal cleavage/methylation domain-containing protein [Nitrospira sp.]|nr:prepilin-type N-terminal cleavage/methylation domain-containing protein [Nitrospira sp.]